MLGAGVNLRVIGKMAGIVGTIAQAAAIDDIDAIFYIIQRISRARRGADFLESSAADPERRALSSQPGWRSGGGSERGRTEPGVGCRQSIRECDGRIDPEDMWGLGGWNAGGIAGAFG